MLQTFQNVELLNKLGPWLFCADSESIIDYYLCQTCKNYTAAGILSIHGWELHEHPRHIDGNVLQEALQRLSTDQRHVLALKIIKRFSNQDAADILSKSIGTIKTIQNQALSILRHLLSSDYDHLFT